MEKSQVQAILKSRKVITQTGKYELRVTSVTPFEKEIGNGRKQVAIANLAAMTGYNANLAKGLYMEGQYNEALMVNNMSLSIRDNDYLPAKGEILEVSVTEVLNKDGINILVPSAYKAQPVKAASNFSFDDEEVAMPRVEMKTQQEEVPAFGKTKQEA